MIKLVSFTILPKNEVREEKISSFRYIVLSAHKNCCSQWILSLKWIIHLKCLIHILMWKILQFHPFFVEKKYIIFSYLYESGKSCICLGTILFSWLHNRLWWYKTCLRKIFFHFSLFFLYERFRPVSMISVDKGRSSRSSSSTWAMILTHKTNNLDEASPQTLPYLRDEVPPCNKTRQGMTTCERWTQKWLLVTQFFSIRMKYINETKKLFHFFWANK